MDLKRLVMPRPVIAKTSKKQKNHAVVNGQIQERRERRLPNRSANTSTAQQEVIRAASINACLLCGLTDQRPKMTEIKMGRVFVKICQDCGASIFTSIDLFSNIQRVTAWARKIMKVLR